MTSFSGSECPRPVMPSHCLHNGRRRWWSNGDRIMFRCESGYRRKGNLFATCLPDGTWSSSPPTCISKQSMIFYFDTTHKRILAPDGDLFTQTLRNLEIFQFMPYIVTGKRSHCEIPLRLRQFSVMRPRKRYYNETDVLHYQCSRGSGPKGKWTSRCLPNGKWSSNFPVCKSKCYRCVTVTNQ